MARARRWFQGNVPVESTEPQYFQVSCAEGHVLQGLRTEGYQALRCPECGEGIFVLPRSPLPEPRKPAAKTPHTAAQSGSIPSWDDPIPLSNPQPFAGNASNDQEDDLDPTEAEEIGFDPVSAAMEDVQDPVDQQDSLPRTEPEIAAGSKRRPTSSDSKRSTRDQPSPRPRSKPEREPSRQPRSSQVASKPLIAVQDRPTISERLKRHRHALIFSGVLVLVTLTVFQVVRRQQSRDLVRDIEVGRIEGIPALERGDFDIAHRLLSRADRAVRALGGEVSGAEEIRQAASEAAIVVDLVAAPLEALLDERARLSDDEWLALFRSSYQNRSILLEARVLPQREWPRTDVPELDYRILTPGPTRPRQGRIDLEGFLLFLETPPEPNTAEPLRFGARLSGLTFDAQESAWLFQLQPESGVFITRVGVLNAMGWGPTPFDSESRP